MVLLAAAGIGAVGVGLLGYSLPTPLDPIGIAGIAAAAFSVALLLVAPVLWPVRRAATTPETEDAPERPRASKPTDGPASAPLEFKRTGAAMPYRPPAKQVIIRGPQPAHGSGSKEWPAAPPAPPRRTGPPPQEAPWPVRKGVQRAIPRDHVPPDPRRAELAARYTQTTPLVGSILRAQNPSPPVADIPQVMAETATAAHRGVPPEGMVLGRCGSCQQHIFAPTARPVLVRCPGCGHGKVLS